MRLSVPRKTTSKSRSLILERTSIVVFLIVPRGAKSSRVPFDRLHIARLAQGTEGREHAPRPPSPWRWRLILCAGAALIAHRLPEQAVWPKLPHAGLKLLAAGAHGGQSLGQRGPMAAKASGSRGPWRPKPRAAAVSCSLSRWSGGLGRLKAAGPLATGGLWRRKSDAAAARLRSQAAAAATAPGCLR